VSINFVDQANALTTTLCRHQVYDQTEQYSCAWCYCGSICRTKAQKFAKVAVNVCEPVR